MRTFKNPTQCPECQKTCEGNQGLSWHRNRAHGVTPASELARQAAKERAARPAPIYGSPEKRAELAALLTRIARNEQIEGYDAMVEAGRGKTKMTAERMTAA